MPDYTHWKWLNESVTSIDSYPQGKKQLHSLTHAWDEDDSLFGKTLGKSRRAWQHPVKMTA